MFNKVIVIGLGLIGGSIAKACKNNHIAPRIAGLDISKISENWAVSNQIIDEIYDFNQKISDDDLVIIATPLSFYEEILRKISTHLGEKTLVVDIGSLKDFVLSLSEKILQNKAKNFVACHPISGSEKSGIVNSDGNLFLGRKVIITKSKNFNQDAVKKAELFWSKIGSSPEFLDSKKHDKIFALVSHLPQFLAFVALEDYNNGANEILNKHFRLQNSNPKIWQEIFSLNRENIEYYLQFYLQNLDKLVEDIKDAKLASFLDYHTHKWARNESTGNSVTKLSLSSSQEDKASTTIQNDDVLLKRLLLVICFLNLPDIEKFQNYGGNGFKDFTSITSHIISQPGNTMSLIEFLHQIKSKITNYEFK